mmetsp:Transcript_72412/g.172578  ORF Transcript_72412/g.172578 Transcript_72412/m.172578 type:complete len:201 (+) Transcript_72412:436-1038(+)
MGWRGIASLLLWLLLSLVPIMRFTEMAKELWTLMRRQCFQLIASAVRPLLGIPWLQTFEVLLHEELLLFAVLLFLVLPHALRFHHFKIFLCDCTSHPLQRHILQGIAKSFHNWSLEDATRVLDLLVLCSSRLLPLWFAALVILNPSILRLLHSSSPPGFPHRALPPCVGPDVLWPQLGRGWLPDILVRRLHPRPRPRAVW